jgi:hypothetical protein
MLCICLRYDLNLIEKLRIIKVVETLIPAKVLSLKRSRYTWDFVMPAQTNAFGWVDGNAMSQINRVVLTSQNTNQVLFDLSNLDRYCSILGPIACKNEELLDKASGPYTTSVLTTATMYASVLAGQQNPVEDISTCNSHLNPTNASNLSTTQLAQGLTDFSGGFQGVKQSYSSGATGTAGYLTFQIDLDSIPFSIFDLDPIMYFSSEQLLLSIYFNQGNRFAWGTQQGNAVPPLPSTGATGYVGNITLNNPTLYLYTEQNLDVATPLVRKVMESGLQIPFAYPFSQRVNSAAGTTASFSQQLSRGFGSKLLFAIWAPFNAQESLNTGMDHSFATSFFAPAVSAMNYQTYVDSIPVLTNSNINVFDGEAWLYNKMHLRDCTIKNINQYYISSAHIDNFCSDPICKINPSSLDGLDLAPIHQYSWIFNAVGTLPILNIYTFFVCQKFLNCTPSGVQIS